jgi:hypothetical protein
VPIEVEGRAVERVRESWLVEDRWWTERPLRRRYWEVLTVDGRNRVLFRDLQDQSSAGPRGGDPGSAGWFSQGA